MVGEGKPGDGTAREPVARVTENREDHVTLSTVKVSNQNIMEKKIYRDIVLLPIIELPLIDLDTAMANPCVIFVNGFRLGTALL